MSTFIVVDDDLSIRYMLRSLLKMGGHTVLAESDNVDSALQYLKNGKVPDVVLLDVILPGGPGYRMIDYIREHHKSVKIALVTAIDEERVMGLVTQDQYSTYIQKPFSSAAFMRKMEALLSA